MGPALPRSKTTSTLKIDSAGEVIRQHRRQAGYTLESASARLGWDKARLSRYESNRVQLTLEALESIAELLGLRPELLVLECLIHRYPHLGTSQSRLGSALRRAIDAMNPTPGSQQAQCATE